jgi:hypothetical protein
MGSGLRPWPGRSMASAVGAASGQKAQSRASPVKPCSSSTRGGLGSPARCDWEPMGRDLVGRISAAHPPTEPPQSTTPSRPTHLPSLQCVGAACSEGLWSGAWSGTPFRRDEVQRRARSGPCSRQPHTVAPAGQRKCPILRHSRHRPRGFEPAAGRLGQIDTAIARLRRLPEIASQPVGGGEAMGQRAAARGRQLRGGPEPGGGFDQAGQHHLKAGGSVPVGPGPRSGAGRRARRV